MMLKDPSGRPIKGIRISLTQRCNLNCFYCHHEGEADAKYEMSVEEVLRIVSIAFSLGIRRVKYTGGEPLLREDLPEIIRRTVSIGMEDTAITTNGSLLRGRATALKEAGLGRLNLSLPSIKPEVYASLTGGLLKDAIEGAREASRLGIEIKANVVVMKGINDEEVEGLIDFTRSIGGSLQLIELEDLGLDEGVFSSFHLDLAGIEQRVAGMAEKVIRREEMNRRTRYFVGGTQVDVVRPVENPDFCRACTRIRVTSDGKLKPCLMRSDNLIDVLTPLRRGCTDAELKALFRKAVSLRSPYYPTNSAAPV
jgi:cyclic pyranopterin phosphate synthase